LPIFSDLSEIVYQLPGMEAWEIAEGILSLLDDEDRKTDILRRQRDWVHANSWAAQAARISNIIHGCFEETRGAELHASKQTRSGLTPLFKDEEPTKGSQEFAAAQKFLEARAVSWRNCAPAGRTFAKNANLLPSATTLAGSLLQSMRDGPSFVPGSGAWFISRADRARDSRDWVSAAQYYRRALDHKPDNPPIWVQYGHALKEAGDLQEAESAYRKSLELDTDVADSHLQLGHVLKIQGRRIEASAAYLCALALDPTLDHATLELKALGWTRGRIQLALRRKRSGTN